MTVQTKHFIDIQDVAAVRLTCRRCETTISIKTPLDSDSVAVFRKCPQCGEGWAVEDLTGADITPIILDAFRTVRRFAQALEQKAKRDGGFALSIEIRSDPFGK